jgi:hypothetical protein
MTYTMSPRATAYGLAFGRLSSALRGVRLALTSPRKPASGLEVLERETDRIRLQSRHWLMG